QQPPRKNAAAKGQKTRHKKNKHALLSSQETTAQPPQAKNQLFKEDGVPSIYILNNPHTTKTLTQHQTGVLRKPK
ncbi:hypothetical protein, partial [Salinactinospora qingdaonensis]|uniref:hypothetical protein n=1 Tax=Salinactinospora qingdaonensis TaxID=702744 RepID=UPI0031E68868